MPPAAALPAALASSPIASWACDRRTLAILAANDAAVAQAELPRESLLALTMHDLWIDAARAHAELLAAAREGRLAVWQQRRPSGDVEVEAAVSPLDGDQAWLVQIVHCGSVALTQPTREMLRRLGGILEHATEGVCLIRPDGIVEYVSPAVEKIFGIPVSQVVGRPAAFFSHPDDLARAQPVYQEVLGEPGGTRSFLGRNSSEQRGERWIEATVTNLRDEPSVRAMVGHFRDVTERVVARRALDEARQRFEYLLSATSAITYTRRIVPPFDLTFIGDNITAVLGYAPRDFLDPSFCAARIHPDDAAAVRSHVVHVFEAGRHVHEYRIRHADGTYRWMHDDVVVVRDEQGAPKEMIGCCFDVTARRDAELAVRRSEASFRALIEHAPLAILVHRDDRIIYANPTMLGLLGYSRLDELVGQSPFSTVAPAHRAAARARTADLMALEGNPRNPLAEGEMIRRDGSSVAIEVEGVKLDFDGAAASVVLARDITESRAMLARLAASDRLASVGTLAAGVAHEINNPLSYVQTNLSLLAEELPALLQGKESARLRGSQLEQLLRDARDGAERMRHLVRDLRAMSHPDGDSVVSVDVREVLERCMRMAENEVRHRARLVTSFADVPPVVGNASRLSQVILNLIINAAQAIPEGSVADNAITLSLYSAASGDVVFEVADTGGGIPGDVLGRIFDPFFTTKPVGVGTGLGLAICHSIVKGMRGEISVESRLGRGTTFRVVLPASHGPASVDRPDGPESGSPIPRSRILIVDDERPIGHSLSLLLGRDHDVIAVTSARDALQCIGQGGRFDVILCDLMMPEMSGMGFYERLARDVPELVARVVFLTGGAFTPAAREFLERIPNRRLEKPFDLDALYDTIRAIRRLK